VTASTCTTRRPGIFAMSSADGTSASTRPAARSFNTASTSFDEDITRGSREAAICWSISVDMEASFFSCVYMWLSVLRAAVPGDTEHTGAPAATA
jgi:hypothetical protein